MIRPATTQVTLPFGATSSPYSPGNPHIGVDFSGVPDDKIYMPETGVVHLVPNDGTCGNAIHIYVDNRHHALCHTSKYLVKDGATVKEGTPIAIMGDTGYAFGVHLHWAVKVNDKFVNPLSLVKGTPMDLKHIRHEIGRQIFTAWGRDAKERELKTYAAQVTSGKYSLEVKLHQILDDKKTDKHIAEMNKK